MYKEIKVNAKSGLETKIEFTPQELDEWNNNQAQVEQEQQAKQDEAAAKAEARTAAEAKLLELGLTTEDLKALLG